MHTPAVFLELKKMIAGRSIVKAKINDIFHKKKLNEVMLNTVWLTFDHKRDKVLVQYYVEDINYPQIEVDSQEFFSFLEKC
jgi:hypothetical protein